MPKELRDAYSRALLRWANEQEQIGKVILSDFTIRTEQCVQTAEVRLLLDNRFDAILAEEIGRG